MYLLNKDIKRLAKERKKLEKSLYLMNIELAKLRSRKRIKAIGQEEMNMVPVTYKDIKLIVY